jgi:hypothetical protein
VDAQTEHKHPAAHEQGRCYENGEQDTSDATVTKMPKRESQSGRSRND